MTTAQDDGKVIYNYSTSSNCRCSYFWHFFSRLWNCCQYSTGFCFGASLINVFINDLRSVFHCFVYISFVGDISIFHAIKAPNDSNLLQSHIDSRRSCGTATWTIVNITAATVNSSSRKTNIRMFVYERYESQRSTKTWGGVFTD